MVYPSFVTIWEHFFCQFCQASPIAIHGIEELPAQALLAMLLVLQRQLDVDVPARAGLERDVYVYDAIG